MLLEHKFLVRRAINGALALRSIETVSPDLILLDIILPDLTGYDLCKQLKANSRTCHIPIIFVSALNDPLDKVKAFEYGGVDYISKPFEMAEVHARVQNHLQLQTTKKELQAAKAESESLNAELEERIQERTIRLTTAKLTLEQELRELHLANQALQESETRFRTLIESTSDIILLVNTQGIIQYVSPSVNQCLGYSPTDLLHHTLAQWIHVQDQTHLSQMLRDALKFPGKTISVKLRLQKRSCEWDIFEVIAQRFIDSNDFSRVVVNARNISELLRI